MKKPLFLAILAVLILSGLFYFRTGAGYFKKYLAPKVSSENDTEGGLPGGTKISANVKSPGETPDPSEPPEDSKYLVFIDPGHGGVDPGTSGNGLVEKDIVLDVCKRLDEILKKSGIGTYMTRTGDTYMDHKDRIALANEKKADIFLSVHCDWFNNPAYGGTQTFYYSSKDLKKGNLEEIPYAKLIQQEAVKAMGTNDRGVAERPDLSVLKRATMPSALIELGFLSNKNDSSLLGSPDFRQKVAEGLASGILKALEKIEG